MPTRQLQGGVAWTSQAATLNRPSRHEQKRTPNCRNVRRGGVRGNRPRARGACTHAVRGAAAGHQGAGRAALRRVPASDGRAAPRARRGAQAAAQLEPSAPLSQAQRSATDGHDAAGSRHGGRCSQPQPAAAQGTASVWPSSRVVFPGKRRGWLPSALRRSWRRTTTTATPCWRRSSRTRAPPSPSCVSLAILCESSHRGVSGRGHLAGVPALRAQHAGRLRAVFSLTSLSHTLAPAREHPQRQLARPGCLKLARLQPPASSLHALNASWRGGAWGKRRLFARAPSRARTLTALRLLVQTLPPWHTSHRNTADVKSIAKHKLACRSAVFDRDAHVLLVREPAGVIRSWAKVAEPTVQELGYTVRARGPAGEGRAAGPAAAAAAWGAARRRGAWLRPVALAPRGS